MRALDVSLSLAGLVVFAPVMALVALAVKCGSRGPVLYGATRVGQGGRLFQIYKFRTMVADADRLGPKITVHGDPRVTRVGRFLRRTKLDELPQLFNTLKGDMSLVGPRPEDPAYVSTYSSAQREVLRVRPGITSPASLVFYDEERALSGADWEQAYRQRILPRKLQIELDYLPQRTLKSDLSILADTAAAMARSLRRGARHKGWQWRT